MKKEKRTLYKKPKNYDFDRTVAFSDLFFLDLINGHIIFQLLMSFNFSIEMQNKVFNPSLTVLWKRNNCSNMPLKN